jgi:hypothetical protein
MCSIVMSTDPTMKKPSKSKKKLLGILPPLPAAKIEPVPAKPLTKPFHGQEDPFARGTHGSPSRKEVRETTHRVMGSRQSQRPLERHNQPRKKRG